MRRRKWLTALAAAMLLALAALVVGQWIVKTSQTPPRRQDDDDGGPSAPIQWRAATTEERREAIQSIQGQLDAFARDDFNRAASFQSKGLQQGFTSIPAFRDMMRQAYPEFVSTKSVRFGAAQSGDEGHFVNVPVVIVGKDGITVRASYAMVREGGFYRVAGVDTGPRPLFKPDVPVKGI